MVVIFVHKYILDLLKLYFILVIKHNTKFQDKLKMYIFSDIFFVRFDIYFISSTCHYTYLVFLILAFNTCKDQTVNIFILKKKPSVYTIFAINTLDTSKTSSFIHKHLYKSTHLFIRTRPMGHFAHITSSS